MWKLWQYSLLDFITLARQLGSQKQHFTEPGTPLFMMRNLVSSKGKLLTEVFQCLFNLLGGEVYVGIWRNEGCMEPVVVVITVDGVGS